MFSRDAAIHPKGEHLPEMTFVIENAFEDFIRNSNLCAGFLCLWDDDKAEISPLTASVIPLEPFVGSRKDSLDNFIKDCLRSHPAPHIHSFSKTQLWNELSSLKDISDWQPRALFLPAFIEDLDFILVCFSDNPSPIQINNDIITNVFDVLYITGFILSANSYKNRVDTMEIYVREIGHDIASSVQAIIAKLRNVSRGLIEGQAAIEKVNEAEEEIMATYRIADTLGITVDPDYNIGSGKDFEPETVIEDAIRLCASEAAERHIEIKVDSTSKNTPIWGDVKAIQTALMQILMNAIKYARGSSYITISVSESHQNVEFSVTNIGLPIDDEERLYIWDFGWRGSRARELHVNGSGIGLYTVKKIVNSHGGSVSLKITGNKNEIVTFIFRIPKKHILKKFLIDVKGSNQILKY